MVQQTSYGKILSFIQDQAAISQLSTFLSDIGFSFETYTNSSEVIDHFKQNGADVILIDLVSDYQKGLEFLSELGHDFPDVPLITLVSNDHKQILQSLRLGAWDCIENTQAQYPALEHAICKSLERARIIHENKKYRYQLEQINTQLESSLNELEFDQMAGKSVQQQMFPEDSIKINQYHFTHKVLPSLYLSGDMVDYFQIDADTVGFYIADVSGHGASSAFVTVMLKVFIDQLLQDYSRYNKTTILHPVQVFDVANRYLREAKLGKYVTMVYCVLNTAENKLKYSIAGHYPSPIFIHDGKAEFLTGKGFAVGMIDQVQFEENEIDFPPDGQLALFSDGLMEEIQGENLDEKENELIRCMHAKITIPEMLKHLNLDITRVHPDDVTLLYVGRTQ